MGKSAIHMALGSIILHIVINNHKILINVSMSSFITSLSRFGA